jgi:hemolysin III
MIAGCYAPVMIQSSCYGVLAVVVALGLAVVPLEAVRLWQLKQPRDDPLPNWTTIDILHIIRYLAMGWACVFVLPAMRLALPGSVFNHLFVGGTVVTLGIIAFVKDGLRFHQAIWHGTVLVASLIFYLSNLFGLVGVPLALV